MKLFIALIFFIFSLTVHAFAKKSESLYQGEQVLHSWTISAGHHISWIKCSSAGNGDQIAKIIKQKIAKLSWSD